MRVVLALLVIVMAGLAQQQQCVNSNACAALYNETSPFGPALCLNRAFSVFLLTDVCEATCWSILISRMSSFGQILGTESMTFVSCVVKEVLKKKKIFFDVFSCKEWQSYVFVHTYIFFYIPILS